LRSQTVSLIRDGFPFGQGDRMVCEIIAQWLPKTAQKVAQRSESYDLCIYNNNTGLDEGWSVLKKKYIFQILKAHLFLCCVVSFYA
jgi:hypothetical protein